MAVNTARCAGTSALRPLKRLVNRIDVRSAVRTFWAFALVAAGVWLFNFHAVNMAVLWLSGRTALLVSLFSIGSVHAMLGRRFILAGVLSLLVGARAVPLEAVTSRLPSQPVVTW